MDLSFSVLGVQQSIIKHPVVSAKLGLQGDDTVQKEAGNPILTNIEEAKLTDPSSKGRMISGHDLTPKELVAVSQCRGVGYSNNNEAFHIFVSIVNMFLQQLSAKYLSGGQKKKSIPLLR